LFHFLSHTLVNCAITYDSPLREDIVPSVLLGGGKETAMKNKIRSRSRHELGPDRAASAISSLPTTARIRWVPRRKAEVVSAVTGGLLTMSEACTRYAVSLEEFAQWKTDWEAGGLKRPAELAS
jgi:hypothetical protein